MNRKGEQYNKGAIDIIEEAVHLLRLSPSGLLTSYYIGSLPFILGLLYFWGDMSRNAFANEYCTAAALGLAMLFIWMKCWHAVFAIQVRARISGASISRWSFRRITRLVTTQAIIQPSGLFILPIALIIAVPFAWLYAFYQNISVQEDGGSEDVKTICKRSWQQAILWPGQNHILLCIFSIFGIFVFLNLAIVIFLLPHLLKKFFGVETVFTMSGLSMLNTTFLATTCGIAYLCMDPLVKTVYALRCFYGSSLRSGDDLKAALRNISSHGKMLTMMVIIFLGSASFCPTTAGEKSEMASVEYRLKKGVVSSEELDGSIREVMNRREFTWRMPRERSQEKDHALPGPLASLMGWIKEAFKTCAKTVGKWVEIVWDWLEKLLPKGDQSSESSGTGWMTSVRGILFVLLTMLVCALVFFFWRIWQRRKGNHVEIVSEAIPSTPDLTDEQTKADEFPVDRWQSLARELMGKGSLRLALRALYLATLAHLAEHQMITIAKYKSNRDYERELRRRTHEKQDLLTAFSKNVTLIDQAWYGMHGVTQEDVNFFTANQKRIMAFVRE